MDDKETLLLAAKAFGIDQHPKVLDGGGWTYNDEIHRIIFWGWDNEPEGWSPRTNDGDAFRLAIKLGIEVAVDYETQTVTVSWLNPVGNPAKCKDIISKFFGRSNPFAAARSVIVHAAAEIGRFMP